MRARKPRAGASATLGGVSSLGAPRGTVVTEQLRVVLPFRAPNPLHPSTAHTMRVTLDRVRDVYTLSVELWLVGVPRSREPHSATAGTVSECIAEVAEDIRAAPSDDRTQLLRGPRVAELVTQCLTRALLKQADDDEVAVDEGGS